MAPKGKQGGEATKSKPASPAVTVNVPATARAAGGGVTPATATSPARGVATGRGPGGRTVTTGTTVAPPRPTGPSRADLFAGTQALFDQQSQRIAESRGLTGGGAPTEAPESVFDPYAAMYAAQQAQEQQNVIAIVTALFKEYGLESLTPKIIEYVKAGYGADAIGVLLRDTPEYKARFPAMASLMAKKRAISEAEYIAYERTAAQLEKQYGLPSGMVMGNVTRLLENEVSATELNDRIILASSASVQAPEEFKRTLQQYYNIGTGGLAAYFLDPAVAAPLLEKQFVSAQIGTEAVRQGVGLDVYGAQNLQSLGITQETARQGFQTVARDIGLTAGRGDVVTQGELIGGTFGDQQQQTAIERARQARLGRFGAGGEFMTEQRGVTGLASAAT